MCTSQLTDCFLVLFTSTEVQINYQMLNLTITGVYIMLMCLIYIATRIANRTLRDYFQSGITIFPQGRTEYYFHWLLPI